MPTGDKDWGNRTTWDGEALVTTEDGRWVDTTLFSIGSFDVTGLHATISGGVILLIILAVIICCYISYRKREKILETLPENVADPIRRASVSMHRSLSNARQSISRRFSSKEISSKDLGITK